MDQVFFSEYFGEDRVELHDQEAAHCALVLRKRAGDRIQVIDGKGRRSLCVIDQISKRGVVCTIISTEEHPRVEQVILAVAPTKNRDRLEWMIEKLVEIGVQRIIIMTTANSERSKVNLDRVMKKAIAATKQSLRFYIPSIEAMPYNEVIAMDADQKLIAHCHTDLKKERIAPVEGSRLILIGPEGDFTTDEVEMAVEHGFGGLDLGEFRLRTETAAIVATTLYQ